MYDNFKVANYNNSLVSPELYARPLSRLFTGEVIDGFTVVPKSNLTVTLQPGNAFVRYGSTDVASARLVSLVAGFDLTHPTADASNPRIDLVVLYVDTSVTFSSATADGKGAAKAMIVAGTPNANPIAPTSTAIQSAVGASNPYIIVSSDQIDAGVTVVASNKITDVRTLAKITATEIDFTTMNTGLFRAHLSTGLSVGSSYTKIAFDTLDFGGTAFDVTTNKGRFTAPVAGYYCFNAVAGANSVGRMTVALYKNGSLYSYGNDVFVASGTGATARAVFSDIIQLAANDYVEIYAAADVTRTLAVGYTNFSGYLLKPS